MRYKVALQAADLALTDIEGVESQAIRFSMCSRLAGVSPAVIKLTLKTIAGDIAIPLNADGEFSLPVTDELREENPWITANQPEGWLIMTASVSIRTRLSPEFHNGFWRVRYSSLFPGHAVKKRLDAVADAISKEHKVKAHFPAPKIASLACDDELAYAKLVVGDNVREIPTEIRGDFLVPFMVDLMALDAWTSLQPAHGWTVTYEFESVNKDSQKIEP